MKIVIRNGYQYFEIGEGMYALVLDDKGDPIESDEREWVETESEYVLYPKVSTNGTKH